MTDSYDVVVIGAGSGGQLAALRLARAGRSVVVVERHRVGGECPYVACIPSKTLLLAARNGIGWAEAVAKRDEASRYRDDAKKKADLDAAGIPLVRAAARVVEPGVVEAGGRQLRWTEALVIGAGSAPTRPPVEGLDDVPLWTSDQALSSDELPGRLLVLGGGPVGCELAQIYARFGARVTLVHLADRLLERESPVVGDALAEVLRRDGIDVRLGTELTAVRRDGAVVVATVGGEEIAADRFLLAAGRHADTAGLGLDRLGVRIPENAPLSVDGRCRVLAGGSDEPGSALPDVFAVGDVTGVAPYTHAANYQAKIAADELAGQGRDADYAAIPRGVYTDPAVFCIGVTAEQARAAGREVRTASAQVAHTTRGYLEEHTGTRVAPAVLELVADADSGVLVGAAAVGPEADSWASGLGIAIQQRLTAAQLAQVIPAFPTTFEVVVQVAKDLAG